MIPHFRLSTGDAHTEAYCIMSIYECPNPYERRGKEKSKEKKLVKWGVESTKVKGELRK